ncbi:hypothetical protein AB0B72_39540, partial [Microbispora sp. NPDC049125]
ATTISNNPQQHQRQGVNFQTTIGGPFSSVVDRPMLCATCKTECRPLLTVSSGEWDGGSGSWIPLEDRVSPGPAGLRRPSDPPMVSIGRGYNMQIYICPESFDHPHLENMQ